MEIISLHQCDDDDDKNGLMLVPEQIDSLRSRWCCCGQLWGLCLYCLMLMLGSDASLLLVLLLLLLLLCWFAYCSVNCLM